MKKLWIIFVAIAIVSCKKEIPVDYAVILGKITNTDAKEIMLYGISDKFFKHKITISEDGTFADTVRVAGTFTLYLNRNRTPLHLKAGNSVNINFDAKDFKNTLTISGKGSEISSYLVSKMNKEGELMLGMGKNKSEIYSKGEDEYKEAINDFKTAQKELLDSITGISHEFRAKEERNIQYSYLEKLGTYKLYHTYYAKKEDFEPSKEFLSELETIAYDSEEDFNFSPAYKKLVTSYYRNKASKIATADDKIDIEIAMLKVYTTIENQTIKNVLIYDVSIYNTDDIEEFYIAYKAAGSTNSKNNDEIEKTYNALRRLVKGNISPKFVNYENNLGGTTSLDDLKGKYVYIDVWATWCGPCIGEIPYLKKIEKQYHNKNIEFLSISIDKKVDRQKWKDMIKDKELGGIQLLADNDWKSKFVKDYLIKGIPRFILLDPKGNIIKSNAPRPSNKKLVELFKELEI